MTRTSYPSDLTDEQWAIIAPLIPQALLTSGFNLDDLTYVLSMTSNTAAPMPAFDPINRPYADHAIGTNATLNDSGVEATDDAEYAGLIAANNLAQNAWQPQWEGAQNFDPTLVGTYTYTPSAFDGETQVASTSIQINAAPEPGSLALLAIGGLGLLRRRRSMA